LIITNSYQGFYFWKGGVLLKLKVIISINRNMMVDPTIKQKKKRRYEELIEIDPKKEEEEDDPPSFKQADGFGFKNM